MPAHIRVTLAKYDQNSFICFPSLGGPWLEAVMQAQMDEFLSLQDSLAPFSGKVDALGIALCARAVELAPDMDGRITLPAALKGYAGIEDEVAFVGQGNRFSLWSPQRFEAESEGLQEAARQQFEELMARRAQTATPLVVPETTGEADA